MRPASISCSLAILMSFVCTSCGDDPNLAKKREMQKAEISRLKADLAVIDEMHKNLPPDVTKDLAEVKQLAATQSAEVTGLKSELAEMEARKKSVKSELETFQTKFRIN